MLPKFLKLRPGIQARVLVFALGLALPALLFVGWLSLRRIASARDSAIQESRSILLRQAEISLGERAIDKADLYDQIMNGIQLQASSVRDVAFKSFTTSQADLPPLRIERFWYAGTGSVANPPNDIRLSVNQAQVVIDTLRTQVNGNELISLGYLALDNGVLVFNYPDVVNELPADFDGRKRDWYIQAVQAQKPIWTEPYVDAVSRDLAITAAIPVTVSNRLIGVVGLDVLLTSIKSDVLSLSGQTSGYAFLMTQDGQILVRPDLQAGDLNWDETFETDNFFDQDTEGLEAIKAQIGNRDTDVVRLTLDGGDRYLAFAPMKSTGWVVGLVLPIDEVVSPAVQAGNAIQVQQDRLRTNLVFILLGTSVAIILLALGLARTIIRPLRNLDHGAQLVAAGDLNHRLPELGNDEIGRLSTSFNAMTLALKDKIGELEGNAEQLAAINNVSNELKRQRSLATVLEKIPVFLCSFLGFDRAVLYLVEGDHIEVTSVSFGEDHQEQAAEFIKTVNENPIPVQGESIEAGVVNSRQAVIVEDPLNHPYVLRNKQAVSHSKSYVQAPIIGRDKVIGIISADYFNQDRKVTVQDASLLLNFADMVGLTIENAFSFQHLEDLVDQRTVELRDALDRAHAADRLKSQFLASVSHELRTPLNAIIGFSTVLIDELTDTVDEAQQEDLETINKNGRYLLDLINDILDMARIEAGRFTLRREPTQVATIIDDAVNLLQSLASEKAVTIRVDVSPHLPTMDVDPTRLRQIMINLLGNALKFTHQGQIVVRAQRRNVHEVTRIGVHTLPAGDWILVSVQDTGIGMDAEAVSNLFQEFQQVHAGARGVLGSGLGLSITRRLIELHHGLLWVDSKPKVGTTFTFVIATSHIPEADPEESVVV